MAARILENKENTEDLAKHSSTTPTPTSTSSDDGDAEDNDYEVEDVEGAANATPQDARVSSSDKSQGMSPKKTGEIETPEDDNSSMPIKSGEEVKTIKPVQRAPLIVQDSDPGIRSPTATPVGKRPHRRNEF